MSRPNALLADCATALAVILKSNARLKSAQGTCTGVCVIQVNISA